MQIRRLVCAACVSAILGACGSDSPTGEPPTSPQNLASRISSGALGEDRSLLWDCVVFDLDVADAPPVKESLTFGDDLQGVDSDGLTFTWSVEDEDTIQATYLDISTSVQLSSIKFSGDDKFQGKSTITAGDSVKTGQLACRKQSEDTFSPAPVFTRIASEAQLRQDLVGKTLHLVHSNINADITINENGKVPGSIVIDGGEQRQFDVDWVWDSAVDTYCRSGFTGNDVLEYECEYIDVIPDAGIRFTYLDGEGSGAGAIEYWAFDSREL